MDDKKTAIRITRERMGRVFSPNQVLGRTVAIGCTAVEITQRCNLDCTLCYLSERSEEVRDIPVQEVFHRLDQVRAQFGPDTSVQITGGDPTLRKHDELIAIVGHARNLGLFPALFTNGIAASRKLLTRLARAGLCDVAFHVDTTQRRDGFNSETDLNTVRQAYLERSAGLGIKVIFNTTIHDGNLHEIPALVRFFTRHADQIELVSLQVQASTGRGEWDTRSASVSLASVRRQIEKGARRPLPWDIIRVGHPGCHSYVPTLVINDKIHPIIEDVELFSRFLDDFDGAHYDRRESRARLLGGYLFAFARRPRWILRAARFVGNAVWRARRDLFAARLRVEHLSFFIQNFMDAANLDPERIEACSFMVMTDRGPVSMCQHNADRDDYILRPITFYTSDGARQVFHPIADTSRAEK
ncbi:MAG: radical SAM protein [Gammaproteobacteria bacterium]|nr:radical SAM protein [Gammaproteobacteria bacterium]